MKSLLNMRMQQMELSLVPEAMMTVCAARDKMKGKSEGQRRTRSLIFQIGQWKVVQDKLSQNSWRTSWPQEKPNRQVTRVDNVVIGLPILEALEMRDTNFTIWIWSDEPVLIAEPS